MVKLLGILIESNLKWDAQVNSMVTRANRRLYMLRSLKPFGMPVADLITVFVGYIRPVLEYACPAWHPGITKTQSDQIERVQKRALRIILANRYDSYACALERTSIPTLSSRREDLCLRFARSAFKSSQWNYWFTPNDQGRTLRNTRLCIEPKCRTERFKRSPIPYFSKQLNEFGL